ncbi:MAG: HipA domain-containing protein [Actinomycetota bacterium]
MAEALAIWLSGTRVALVEQERGKLRLAYTPEAMDRYPLGSPLLSLSLPLTSERYPQGVVRAFIDGLLPEGEPRRAAAADFELVASDTFGLVRAIGRDCAGALIIQPVDEPPPPSPTTLTAEPLSEADIVKLVGNLRSAPLGVSANVRISLAGMQEKLLLTQMPDGSWGRPVAGTPSTHILKPEHPTYPDTVENEAFCMRVARNLGLPVASVKTTTIGGRRLLVVERYDRVVSPDGAVERLHQEDFCQALGIPPEKKYQENGGPSLQRLGDVLQAAAGPDSIETLLQGVAVNVLLANGDAHGKNFSLLHAQSGALVLAPFYDLMSTLPYGDDRLAMYVDDVRRTNRVTGDRIVNEAVKWGMSKRRAAEVVGDILARTPGAVEAARQETEDVPDGFPRTVESQLAQVRSSFAAAT